MINNPSEAQENAAHNPQESLSKAQLNPILAGIDQNPVNQDLNQSMNLQAVPRVATRIEFNDFLAMAKERPEIYLRNSAQQIADAMTAYGVHEEEIFGKPVLTFDCMSGPFRSDKQLDKREPRGQEEGIQEIYDFFKEQGRQGRPNKGLMISSVPGAGKNCVLDAIMDTVADYANNHPEGARWRVALRFDTKESAERAMSLGPKNHGKAPEHDPLTGAYVISSSTNANPVSLLSTDRPFLKDGNGKYVRGESERDAFIDGCGDTCNREFVLSSSLDPTIAQAYNALVNSYTDKFNGDRERAIAEVRQRHVIAEKVPYDPEMGEGVLTRMPHADLHSDASSLAGSMRLRAGPMAPNELDHAADKIWRFNGPLLNADLIHYEDMLMLVRAPQEILTYGHLNALIERGQLQIVCREDPSRIFTLNKDLTVVGSVNDEHIHMLKEATSFAALMARFNVVTWQLIRDYTKEAEAHRPTLEVALGNDIEETPHALELASLFVVSTRLLDPQASNYEDDTRTTKNELGILAERLVGVQKALYLGSKDGQEARSTINTLLPKSERFSAEEMKILEVGDNKWRIAHEYKGDVMKKNVSLYDGGFGISTRDAQELIKDIVQRARLNGTDFTVKTVVDELREKLERGFHYFEAPSATLEEVKKQNFSQLCMKEGIGEAEIRADIDQSSGKLGGRAKELWDKAVKTAEASFPLRPPSSLVDQIDRYGRLLVQNDVRSASGLVEQSNLRERLEKYIMHLAAFSSGREVPAKYRSEGLDAEKAKQADLAFMKELEADADVTSLDSSRDKFREKLWKEVSSWSIKKARTQKGAAGGGLENFIGDIFEEQMFGDLLTRMKEKFDQENKAVIDEFLEDLERYKKQPELLEKDKQNVMRQERANRYEEASQSLLDSGYKQESLAQLVRWGFAIDANRS